MCAWAAPINPGRPIGQYFAHIGQACRILDISLSRSDTSVTASVRDLRKEQNRRFKFDIYMCRGDLVTFLERETLPSEFGLIWRFLSYSFCGYNQKAYRGADRRLLGRTREVHSALIGVFDVKWEGRLAMELSRRKTNGAGLLSRDRAFSPASRWPLNRLGRVARLGPLFGNRVAPLNPPPNPIVIRCISFAVDV